MTNLRQLFLKLVAFNLLLSLSLLTLDAQAQYGNGGSDFYYDQPTQDNIVLSNLNINVYGQKQISIKQLVNQHYGQGVLNRKKLKRIVVRASAQSNLSHIALLINGVQVTAVRNISYSPQQIILDLPTSNYHNSNIIGQDIQTIKLKVKGNVQIKRIAVKLQDNINNSGAQVLRARNISVGYNGSNAEQLRLSDILRTNGINQKMVQQIKISASSPNRRAVMTVTAQGIGPIKTIHLKSNHYGSGSTEVIHLGPRTPLSSIKLVARGRINIQSIEVLVKSPHGY